MSSLIKNEITKILKKKSLYIMLIVILAYVIFANIMYKYAYSSTQNYIYSESYIKMLEEDIKNLNPENLEEVDQYISSKTEIDTYNLIKEYDEDSWQYEVILDKGTTYISAINYYTYKEKNSEALENAKIEYNNFVEKLNSNDVPDDGRRFAVVGVHQWNELLKMDEFVSADYVGSATPLIDGCESRKWLGINWVLCNSLPLSDTDKRDCFIYHASSIGHACGQEVKTDITWHGERAAHFISNSMSQGAVLIDNEGIVRIKCDDDAQ